MEITITQLSELYQNHDISVKEVVQAYLSRIEKFDRGEDGLNSILEINPEAITIAEYLDEHQDEYHSNLYGVPIILKDNINTADQMHTSAGSLSLATSIAAEDADLVKTLRKSGAVILGKANMTEFANYMTMGMPPGYSSRGGYVHSPYQRDGDPSGSSTGSAVAVTANLCTASIGSDTSGSIVSPSIKNGIVGFRPSIGSFSQKGLLPISFSLDMAGPMTRTVADSIIIFSDLMGKSIPIDEVSSLSGMMIGINEMELKDISAEEMKKAENIFDKLKQAGAQITSVQLPVRAKANLKTIQKYEFKYAINKYLSELPKNSDRKTLKSIIEFNNLHAAETLLFGQSLLTDAQENTSGLLTEADYIRCCKDRNMVKDQLQNILSNVDIYVMLKENLVLQYAGLPVITLPCGLHNDGMPYGIFLTARTDEILLKQALQVEQVIGSRVGPKGYS
jgi:amidase